MAWRLNLLKSFAKFNGHHWPNARVERCTHAREERAKTRSKFAAFTSVNLPNVRKESGRSDVKFWIFQKFNTFSSKIEKKSVFCPKIWHKNIANFDVVGEKNMSIVRRKKRKKIKDHEASANFVKLSQKNTQISSNNHGNKLKILYKIAKKNREERFLKTIN